MEAATSVDESLHRYFDAVLSKDNVEEADIQELLDAYRVKLEVDFVYVGEILVDRKGIIFTHVSYSSQRYNLLGKAHLFREDWEEILAQYNEDGLCDQSLDPGGANPGMLHYGVIRGGEYEGEIGVIDFHRKRIWTPEERLAVRRLGRLLKNILYIERGRKVSQTEQEKLDQQSHVLEAIFSTTDCGIMRHSLDGRRVFSINKAALDILGYASVDELMDAGFSLIADSVLEEDKPKLRAAIRELRKVGDSISISYRVQHEDGKILNVAGRVKLLEEHGEQLYQRFLFDCTAQKAQEEREQLEVKNRQAEMIQALSVDFGSVYFVDLDTGMAVPYRMNADITRRYGDIFVGEIPLTDSMERYISDVVYAPDQALLRQASAPQRLAEELAEKESCHTNYRTMRNGEIQYFQMKAVRAGAWESTHRIVLGFRSVDDEIRHEMAQKKLVENALAEAEHANQAKSAFLFNMSHDIRTPMNAIIGFTTLAISHIDQKERVRGYLGKIMSSGNHLLSLINDVLDMSRIESGKVHIEERPCSLPDILRELRNILQSQVAAHQLDLFIDTVDVRNEDIFCDKLRLNQVLLNLLGNAVKFTGAGGTITVRIIEKPCDREGYGNFEFHVRDTGIGMSKEFISHIFEPFERERSSTISGIQGTGLGMAITKNLVDLMHGTISVKSKQGQGTEFVVALTFRLQQTPQAPRAIPELQGCRALVVDDDFNTCDSVTGMLQQIGMRSEWTLSGREAVLRTRQAAARGDAYHVYIIDWLMPDMNGVEVARRIRKEAGESAPIVVLTAYDWSDIEEEAKTAGVTAFCGKPLFLSELRACLEAVVAPRPAGGEEDPSARPPERPDKGRILLAEDNELNREIATELLSEAGFQVSCAENGQAALEMLREAGPGYYRLILMDVQMPVMDGYDATRAIRRLKDPQLASVPILAMTANAFEEDRQAALECGMNGHIPKPIDVANLLDTLEKTLEA